MLQFCHRANVDVISKMRKHRRANSPLFFRDSFFNKRRSAALNSLFSGLSIDHLVETGKHVASCYVFEGHARLYKQTSLRDFNRSPLPVSCPDGKSWIARFAMNRHEADVIMPTGKYCTNFIFLQITTCRGQKVSPTFHSLREGLLWHTHSDGSHLSDDFYSVEHFEPPTVHLTFPVSEVLGDNLWEIVSSTIGSFSDFPHEAPLCIKNWLNR